MLLHCVVSASQKIRESYKMSPPKAGQVLELKVTSDDPTYRRRSLAFQENAVVNLASPQKEGGLRIAAIGCLVLAASVVIGRAYHLQIKNGAEYQGAAKRQSNTQRRVVAKRGTILDRNGDELALTVNVDTIFAEPRRIKNPLDAANQLAPILDIPRKQLASRLNSKRYFRYIKRRVSPRVAARVQALNIRGIGIEQEPRRFYSSRNLASHILGFTNHEGKYMAPMKSLRGRTYEAFVMH